MNPNDYYRLKSGEIREADIRLVAACMSDHVGEENAVRLETLVARCGLGERQVRDILEVLVKDHGWPIGAHSGKAGRWLARSFDEARETQAEYYSRAREDKRRGDAFNTCNYPPKPAEELRELQPTLIDVPEPDPIPFWRW
ncbi:MAG TPA: hypothetical protein PLP17_12060 [Oligoflexia bacterium]|nr:hypothetical protein [Oligoflexia bacterium]